MNKTQYLIDNNSVFQNEDKTLWGSKCPKCNDIKWSILKNNAVTCFNRICKKCRKYDGKNNPMYGKIHSIESKIKIGISSKDPIRHLNISKSLMGKMVGSKNPMFGKKKGPLSNETKKKIGIKSRINILKRIEKLGIVPSEDKGAREWFCKYNKENNTNFKSKTFWERGYRADGYDENLHIWIEYDTYYHLRHYMKEKDLIRQNNIIKYFENIGNPLNEFKRVITWNNNEIITVYRNYQD